MKVAEKKKPLMRVARANAFIEFYEEVNASNRKMGIVGGFGRTGSVKFEDVHGMKVDKDGRVIKKGKSYDQVTSEAVESAVRAELAGNRACEVCEYANDIDGDGSGRKCPRRNRLYEKLCAPEQYETRKKIWNRMKTVQASKGAKTMSCIKAAKVSRPKKTDWDY